MKRHIIFLFLSICFHQAIYGQIIRGTVLEKNTRIAIQNAVVYFNGTSVGTYTDKDGYFVLDISKNISMPLTVSALGYFSVTLNNFPIDSSLIIYLPLKVFELNEVTISGKPDVKSRKQNLKIFKEIFLGTTDNASNCKIINDDDIIIFHKNDTLKAYSLKPLLVDNKALGYKISYYLDMFEFDEKSQTYLFTGNIIFDEDLTTSDRRKKLIDIKRQQAYYGSRMHFFRALWENKLDTAGFSVQTLTKSKADYNDIVIQKYNPLNKDTIKYLKYQERLGISYFRKFPESFIHFKQDSIFFDRNGYFDGMGITWEGRMGVQRIADMLPTDYIHLNNSY